MRQLKHASSKLIVERRPKGTVWRGTVDVFDIIGHAETTRVCLVEGRRRGGEDSLPSRAHLSEKGLG